jgi:hypothetical protein
MRFYTFSKLGLALVTSDEDERVPPKQRHTAKRKSEAVRADQRGTASPMLVLSNNCCN